MKKYLISAFALLLSAVSFTSCNKDKEPSYSFDGLDDTKWEIYLCTEWDIYEGSKFHFWSDGTASMEPKGWAPYGMEWSLTGDILKFTLKEGDYIGSGNYIEGKIELSDDGRVIDYKYLKYYSNGELKSEETYEIMMYITYKNGHKF